VVIATRELPAGAALAAGDLGVSRVRVDEATYSALVPAAERDVLVGRTLAEPVHAHQLLARAQVAGRALLGPDQVALTLPVGPETTVGGRLRPGDAVRVLATTDRGKPESRTFVVVPRVTVSDLGREERGGVGAGSASASGPGAAGRTVSITVICSPEQAREVAWARWNAELDFVALPPEDGGGG
jgi:Flp pilus assembly protein CpaB